MESLLGDNWEWFNNFKRIIGTFELFFYFLLYFSGTWFRLIAFCITLILLYICISSLYMYLGSWRSLEVFNIWAVFCRWKRTGCDSSCGLCIQHFCSAANKLNRLKHDTRTLRYFLDINGDLSTFLSIRQISKRSQIFEEPGINKSATYNDATRFYYRAITKNSFLWVFS